MAFQFWFGILPPLESCVWTSQSYCAPFSDLGVHVLLCGALPDGLGGQALRFKGFAVKLGSLGGVIQRANESPEF